MHDVARSQVGRNCANQQGLDLVPEVGLHPWPGIFSGDSRRLDADEVSISERLENLKTLATRQSKDLVVFRERQCSMFEKSLQGEILRERQ